MNIDSSPIFPTPARNLFEKLDMIEASEASSEATSSRSASACSDDDKNNKNNYATYNMPKLSVMHTSMDSIMEPSTAVVRSAAPPVAPRATRHSIMLRSATSTQVLDVNAEGIIAALDFLWAMSNGTSPPMALERTPASVYGPIVKLVWERHPARPPKRDGEEEEPIPDVTSFGALVAHPLIALTSAGLVESSDLEEQQLMAHYRVTGVIRMCAEEASVPLPSVAVPRIDAAKSFKGTNSPASAAQQSLTPTSLSASTVSLLEALGDDAHDGLVCCEAMEAYLKAKKRLRKIDSVMEQVTAVFCDEDDGDRLAKLRKLVEPYKNAGAVVRRGGLGMGASGSRTPFGR
eukprot:PhM_4_TR5356/c0_g1_i1/m.88459